MTTLARTRAETQFASITSSSDRMIEPTVLPLQTTVETRQAGPNTLHLPDGTLPRLVGWPIAGPRRVPKAVFAHRGW